MQAQTYKARKSFQYAEQKIIQTPCCQVGRLLMLHMIFLVVSQKGIVQDNLSYNFVDLFEAILKENSLKIRRILFAYTRDRAILKYH